MNFFFGLLDVILLVVMLFDTLGLAYEFRHKGTCDKPKDYVRVCLSWILFLTICSLFSCNKQGFFGFLIQLIIFLAKASVSLPIVGGTLKIYKFLIEEKRAEMCCQKICGIIQSKLCKEGQCCSSSPDNNIYQETPSPQ